jgi:uncharacterized membrane protein YkvA (DUF1232 family)
MPGVGRAGKLEEAVGLVERWRIEARRLKREVYALYLACRDHRVPWYAKVLAAGIVAYAFSPIDLIPDFIPILGYLDELVLLPLGVLVVLRLIPEPVMADCRLQAEAAFRQGKPVSRVGAAIVIGLWLILAVVGIVLASRLLWPED